MIDNTTRLVNVYEITCLVNGKKYIGITTASLRHRWWHHVRDTRRGNKPPTRALQRAIALYGKAEFEIVAVDVVVGVEAACLRERQLIAEMGTMVPAGYNLTTGGDGIGEATGATHSAETRLRRSLALKGCKRSGWSDETRAKILLVLRGRKLTEDHRRKIGAGLTGFKRPPISDQVRANMRAAQLGRKQSPATIEKRAAKLRGRPGHPNTIAAATGRETSQLCRERTAAANRIRDWTPEARAKLSAYHIGRSPTPEAIEMTATHNRGRALPQEQKAKMSAARKAWWSAHKLAQTPEVKARQGRP